QTMLQDRDGYLWIGTQAGLNRFDGQAFEVFGVRQGLSSDFSTALAQDHDGAIWVGTQDGVSRWTPATGFHSYREADELPHRRVHALAVTPDGRLWAGTAGGLALWDGRAFDPKAVPEGLAGHAVVALLP